MDIDCSVNEAMTAPSWRADICHFYGTLRDFSDKKFTRVPL